MSRRRRPATIGTTLGTFRRVLVCSFSDVLWIPRELGDGAPDWATHHAVLITVDLPHDGEARDFVDIVGRAQCAVTHALCGAALSAERCHTMPAHEPITCDTCNGLLKQLANDASKAVHP